MNEKQEQPIFTSEISRIDWLNLSAWQIRVTDSNKAFELSKEAVAAANEIEYNKGKAEGLRTFGFCHIRRANYQKALALLNEAQLLFVDLNDTQNQSVIHEYLGIVYRSLGDYATSLEHLFKAVAMSQLDDYKEEESLALYHLSTTYKYLGDLTNALEYSLKGLQIAQQIGETMAESYHLNCIGGIYYEMGQYEEALDYYQKSLALRRAIGDKWGEAGCYDNIGNIYLQKGNYEEALNYCLLGLEITDSIGDQKGKGNTLFNAGKIYVELGDPANALHYCKQSLQIREKIGDKKGRAEIYNFLGAFYEKQSIHQKALDYLNEALALADEIHAKDTTYKIHLHLSKVYKQIGDYTQALIHFETYTSLEKEVNNETINQRILNLQTTHRVEQSQKEAEIFRLKNVELIRLIEEVESQKQHIERALNDLKSTQNQLIQKEKLASLGELTAGIAHEIQNPLNFVNNFSEMSVELIQELIEEENRPLTAQDTALKTELLNDLAQNQEKIAHHGKRASSIVTGMLEHSRTSTGEREMTDLNKLADEYLRLAYHGMRAKYKNFNSDYELIADENLPHIKVVPQDIGRVLLNLINNAFYAVNQKNIENPKVIVAIEQLANEITLRIKDNGIGIPDDIKPKIFQPFFTTKPTGEGTGLGLSLAYDIVTKGCNGRLDVISTVGKGTEMVVWLPY